MLKNSEDLLFLIENKTNNVIVQTKTRLQETSDFNVKKI